LNFPSVVSKIHTLLKIILGAFRKLPKATISFAVTMHPHGTRLPVDGFSWNLIFSHF